MLLIAGKTHILSKSFSLMPGEFANIVEPDVLGEGGMLLIKASNDPIENADVETGLGFEEISPSAFNLLVPFVPGTSFSFKIEKFANAIMRINGICTDKFMLVQADITRKGL